MSEIKLNVSVPKKLGINAGPTQLLSGATFIPNVDAEGNISWTNDKGLENPQTQNIMGPQGKDGPPGPQGEPGASYELPIASSEVLGGIKVGEGLEIDPLTGVLKSTGESSTGPIKVLVATKDNPVDLNNLTDIGMYYIVNNPSSIAAVQNAPFSGYGNFLLQVIQYSQPTNGFIVQIIISASSGGVIALYSRANTGNWASWSSSALKPWDTYLNSSFYPASARTVYVLNQNIGDPTTLQTENKDSLVEAINELKSRIDNLESN